MKTKADKVKAQPAPFLEKVAGFMPVARGSLALVRKACGKPGCNLKSAASATMRAA